MTDVEGERMSEQERTDEDAAREGGPGDVETAGETTAVAALEGPADTRPVGAGTTAPVEGDPKPARGADE
jgi:hypothetical protein